VTIDQASLEHAVDDTLAREVVMAIRDLISGDLLEIIRAIGLLKLGGTSIEPVQRGLNPHLAAFLLWLKLTVGWVHL
jgi:hypothetical protein